MLGIIFAEKQNFVHSIQALSNNGWSSIKNGIASKSRPTNDRLVFSRSSGCGPPGSPYRTIRWRRCAPSAIYPAGVKFAVGGGIEFPDPLIGLPIGQGRIVLDLFGRIVEVLPERADLDSGCAGGRFHAADVALAGFDDPVLENEKTGHQIPCSDSAPRHPIGPGNVIYSSLGYIHVCF